MQEKEGMLEASPTPGGMKAACLLINSKNITAQMLIFPLAIFLFKMLPFLIALQLCFPLEQHQAKPASSQRVQEQGRLLPQETEQRIAL